VILAAGWGWYAVKGRHHIGTLESHAETTTTESANVTGSGDLLKLRDDAARI
jgi:hypothetical protein